MSDSFDLPPASFEFLVLSLKMQAEMRLGLMRDPESHEPAEPFLPGARHAIDLLAMLEAKTRGNLTDQERRSLENSLTELRFRYVQVTEAAKQKPAAADAV